MPRVSREWRSTSTDVYKRFKSAHPELNLSYMEWCNIIYTFNYGFRDYLLETGFKARFPYGFGDFAICKYKPKKEKTLPSGETIVGLPINWQRTKETGNIIYHMNHNTEGYKFRWLWFQNKCKFFRSDVWVFKPSRVSSRLIAHYVRQGYDQKYLQWKT